MKHIKKELSFLLVFALVVTSLVVGFGQLSAAAYDDFVGAGILRVDVKVRGDSCDSGPRGTDSSFRLDLLDANGNIVSSSPTLIGFYRPPATTDDPLSSKTWTTYTHDGSNPDNRDVRVTVPGLGNMVVTKHVSQLRFIEVAHEHDFIHESIVVYYYDGGTWVEIGRHNYTGNVPQFKGVGDHKTFPTTWFINNNKTLNFDANGGTGGGTYNAIPNQTIAATEPTGTGYTFDGWSPEVPARMPNADTTYTAQWNPREYSITFDANGGTGGTTASLLCGSSLTPPEVTRAGYSLAGWSPSVPTSVPAADTTYTAIWLENGETNTNIYSITFDPNGGSGNMPVQEASFGQTTVLADNAFTKVGYSFSGWATSASNADSGATEYLDGADFTLFNDVTLYAVWTPNLYAMTFLSTGGMGATSIYLPYGAPLVPPTVTREGYEFSGWLPSPPATVPAENSTFAAQWDYAQYTITFDAMGGSVDPASKTVTYLGTYGELPTAIKPGFFQNRWSCQFPGGLIVSDIYSTDTVTTPADLTFTASYRAVNYTISYNGNGSTGGSTASSAHGYNLPKDLTLNGFVRPGYTFSGWAESPSGPVKYTDGESVVNLTQTNNATVTLYAKWTANTYTINYAGNDSTDGNTPSSLHTYGLSATLTPNGFVKTGFVFLGWSTDANAVAAEYTDAQNILNLTTTQGAVITFYAVWGLSPYTITFDTDGGSAVSAVTQGNGTQLQEPVAPVKENFTFGGWYADEARTLPVEWPHTITEDATFYAKWTINYTISFDTDGGSMVSTVTQGNGTQLQEPVAPIKGGCIFGGWYADEARTLPVEWPHTITEDATFYALWHINSYTITFDANGGTGGTIATMPFGSPLTAPIVARSTYTFAGWSPAVPETVPAENTVYTAQWTATTETQYIVTFDALGGTVSPATSTVTYGSTYGEGTGGLPTPSRFTRNFLYWYANIDGNVVTVTDTTTVTADAAHTLYARWNASSSTFAWTTGYFTHTGATQAKISRYTGPSGGHLTIPSTLDGIPVTSLGYRTSYLFDEWPFMTRCPATLSLPATITRLDFMAFSDTDALSAIYFWGDAPEVDTSFSSNTKIYYLAGRTGYTTPTWQGRPCEPFNGVTVNFDANGGTGGTSALTIAGLPLSAPTVTKPGYVFAGWSPAVPATVPAQNTTYTAQYYAMPGVRVTKLADGFKVAVTNPQADYRYQIWSYQQLTGDLLGDGTVSQWVLSKPYTLGANGTAEGDGSAGFTIPAFTSNDGNYTVAVRITDASGNYLGEVRDTYTPADVSEVKITKVLVDGGYSAGTEIREIRPGASMTFMVVGNGVPGTACTALVEQPDTPSLTANSAIAFTWNIAGMTPGTYTVRFTAGNGVTSDTRTLRVQLYSLDAAIQYGRIDALALTAPEGPALPKTMTLTPDIENGSFYYRVGEPGRKAMFTSGLFDPGNTAEYTFAKFGVYQVASFVNREYEVKIGNYYDDGIIQNFAVRRSDTEPSSVTLTADGVDFNNPIQKSTTLTFVANAQIGGIGATPVEYSFWRQDAKGYALVRDWSADNTLEWTAARVGIYVFEVRAKGVDAGSYEVAKTVRVTVTDTEEDFARDVVITLNEDELGAATARVPITLKANATSSNSEDLLYRFHVHDSAMGTRTIQNYSAAQHCVWTPRKAGTYTVSVLVKNQASFGAYDAMQTFTVTVN